MTRTAIHPYSTPIRPLLIEVDQDHPTPILHHPYRGWNRGGGGGPTVDVGTSIPSFRSPQAPGSPPHRGRRKRVYTLYSLHRRPTDLSNRYRDHLYGSHRWRVEVYARSIRQAYYLAGNEIFAAGPREVGVRRIEPHHRLRDEVEGTPPPEPTVAPYLSGEPEV